MINFVALYLLMRKETRVLETTQLLWTLGKLLVAGSALAGVCWAGQHWLLAGWGQFGLVHRIGGLLLIIAVGATVFFALATLLRIEEMDDAKALVVRKLGRFRKRAV